MATRKFTPSQQISAFWAKVTRPENQDECWLWNGATVKGYGQFRWKDGFEYAHRISWTLVNGEIPDGMCVLHNCPDGDNPRCCNPSHLWLGTLKENNQDRSRKGRNHSELRRGVLNGRHTHPEAWRKHRRGSD